MFTPIFLSFSSLELFVIICNGENQYFLQKIKVYYTPLKAFENSGDFKQY